MRMVRCLPVCTFLGILGMTAMCAAQDMTHDSASRSIPRKKTAREPVVIALASHAIDAGIDVDNKWVLTTYADKFYHLPEVTIIDFEDVRKHLRRDGFDSSEICSTKACMLRIGTRMGVSAVVAVRLAHAHDGVVLYQTIADVSKNAIGAVVRDTLDLSNEKAWHESMRQAVGAAVRVIRTPARQVVPRKQRSAITLSIHTIPQGAQLTLNDSIRSNTPFKSDSLAPGAYTIGLAKAGYKYFTKTLRFKEHAKKKITVRLAPDLPTLVISSEPSGATVFVDQKKVGETPWEAEKIRTGTHVVRVEKEEYVPATQEVTVDKYRSDSMHIVMVAQAYVDSVNDARRRKFRNARRVVFGSTAALFGIIGIVNSAKARRKYDERDSAYDKYRAATVQADIDALWQEKSDAQSDAERYRSRSVANYVIGGFFALGFAISIPF
ncbi:MAG: PEGA domain-containing protein [Chitinivibrionales bacterium]|nr:PEGA domain-containing protein [Chitinivibrionales bacterium]